MRTSDPRAWLMMLCLAPFAAAQGIVVEGLRAARARLKAKDASAALEVLAALRVADASDDERAELCALLHEIGVALDRGTTIPAALDAKQRLLAVLRESRGEEDDVDVAAVLNQVGSCLRRLGRIAEGRQHYDTAMSMRRRLYGDVDHPEIAQSLGSLGHCAYDLADYPLALDHYQQSLAMFRRSYGDVDNEDTAIALRLVARTLDRCGRFEEALKLYEEARAMRDRLHGEQIDAEALEVAIGIASCFEGLGRANDAHRRYETVLAMHRQVHGDRDDPGVARALNDLAGCKRSMGLSREALPLCQEAAAMARRIAGDRDDPSVVLYENNLGACLLDLDQPLEALRIADGVLAASERLHGGRSHAVAEAKRLRGCCLETLARHDEALAAFQASLAAMRSLHGPDHPSIVRGLGDVASCLSWLDCGTEALPLHEEALAMSLRVFGARDAFMVAKQRHMFGRTLLALGRPGEALPHFEASLAMRRRVWPGRDHSELVAGLGGVADALSDLGRASEALPLLETACAMSRRLHSAADHRDLVGALSRLAACLEDLGRSADALPLLEEVEAMTARLGRDREVALHNLASCLATLGRYDEALGHLETARQLRGTAGQDDDSHVAATFNSLGLCLAESGRAAGAIEPLRASLAIRRRLHGTADHPSVALGLNNLAYGLRLAGRVAEALPLYDQALAMRRRLYGDLDHPVIAQSLGSVARCLRLLGRSKDAIEPCENAVAMIERLREASAVSASYRQSLFELLKRGDEFERLQALYVEAGRPSAALEASERSRSREFLDGTVDRHDLLETCRLRAERRGDTATATRLASLRDDLDEAALATDRHMHELIRIEESGAAADRERRRVVLAETTAASTKYRQLLDERARLVADARLGGRVRTAREIQATLRAGELFVEFTVSPEASFVYVVPRDGEVAAFPLPRARAALQRRRAPRFPSLDAPRSSDARGREPTPEQGGSGANWQAANDLFASLIPPVVWERLRAARHVFVAAHRELHELPFEALVTGERDGAPVFWLEDGPPVSYVPSGSVLHWLRQRAVDASDDATSLDLLAIGDPAVASNPAAVPEQGVLVTAVNEGGEAARVGLRPGDVLVGYDGKTLRDDRALRDLIPEVQAAVEDGLRAEATVRVDVWRPDGVLALNVRVGRLGIEAGKAAAGAAYEAMTRGANVERVVREGDLERVRRLPPLKGARAEVDAIAKVFNASKRATRTLLGADASEAAVFELAPRAKYLHFACHGIAEEYAGHSLSLLVLSQPEHVMPGDDGLLKLEDLYRTWSDRLSSCRLVVLSACRTSVGPTLRDEAPQALPVGLLYAGAPAVISSLWAVDDESTRELMADFYARLLGGQTDKLAAFTDAKKALRARHPDPFHWAPFLFVGCPD